MRSKLYAVQSLVLLELRFHFCRLEIYFPPEDTEYWIFQILKNESNLFSQDLYFHENTNLYILDSTLLSFLFDILFARIICLVTAISLLLLITIW